MASPSSSTGATKLIWLPPQVRLENSNTSAPAPTVLLENLTEDIPPREHIKDIQGEGEIAKRKINFCPLRKEYTPTSIEIITNHFKVTQRNVKLYIYNIKGIPDKATRPKRRVLISEMIEANEVLKKSKKDFATDYRSQIVACKPLLNAGEVMVTSIKNWKPGGSSESIALELVLSDVNGDDIGDHLHGRKIALNQEVKRALNTIISKSVHDADNADEGANHTFQLGANRFYYRPGWNRLRDNSILMTVRGYHCSVRFCLNNLLLNVNTVTSAFYMPQTLQSLLNQLHTEHQVGNDDARLRRIANAYVRGLRVYINFERWDPRYPERSNCDPGMNLEKRRIKTVHSIGLRAKLQNIQLRTGTANPETISVWKHMEDKYGDSATRECCEDDFAVNIGGVEPRTQQFYLASHLYILRDQPYKRPMTPEETERMIGVARRSPDQNCKAIVNEGFQSLYFGDQTQKEVLKRFGMEIDAQMVKTKALVCKVPQILYSGYSTLGDENWRPYHKAVFCDVSKGFAGQVIFISEEKKIRDQILQLIQDSFLLHYQRNGVKGFTDKSRGFPRSDSVTFGRNQDTKAFLRNLILSRRQNADLFVLILPDKSSRSQDQYASFKRIMDQEFGVKSLTMCAKKFDLNKRPSPNRYFSYIFNLAMKLNLRLGGANHAVQFSGPLKTDKISKSTLIIGADVTHPGSSSLAGALSIAAVVGSVDAQFAKFRGSMRLQKRRDELIPDLEEMVVQRVEAWKERNQGRSPETIIYYRDGIDESRFDKVRETEVRAIRSAWTRTRAQPTIPAKEAESVHVIAIVCLKRHHVRVFREESGLHKNCQPGTCVDQSITSPYFTDFFLLSHSVVNSGTAKPTHYMVVANDYNSCPQILQNVTNELCYAYNRSTCPVSYPAPAYYADRLCERGRQYVKKFYDGDHHSRDQSPRQQATTMQNEWETTCPTGKGSRNGPWHRDLDDTMFWM